MHLQCHHCEATFDERDALKVTDDAADVSVYQGQRVVHSVTYLVCPTCKSDELEQVFACDACCTFGPLVPGFDLCETCMTPADWAAHAEWERNSKLRVTATVQLPTVLETA